MKEIHSNWMKYALREAERAFDENEVPVGCVIIHGNRIIAKAHNQIEMLNDPTAHAEMLALTSAFDAIQNKQLKGCSMYVTLEPCTMCAGALVLAKIENIYFGAYDIKSGACGSVLNITNNKSLNHISKVYGGILDKECGMLLKAFFDMKRNKENGLNNYSVN
ncbi:MAG: tRNA adenosine(34) deaminase TadA [Ignavibacteria bacterium]|nr:tRNA adenosine(34) deaminase TadA [Ignavibacteria bacterium]